MFLFNWELFSFFYNVFRPIHFVTNPLWKVICKIRYWDLRDFRPFELFPPKIQKITHFYTPEISRQYRKTNPNSLNSSFMHHFTQNHPIFAIFPIFPPKRLFFHKKWSIFDTVQIFQTSGLKHSICIKNTTHTKPKPPLKLNPEIEMSIHSYATCPDLFKAVYK